MTVIWSVAVSGRTLPDPSRPNILVIMADDLDSRQLSIYGGKNLVTGNIDELARSGMRFTNMIASETMCVPVRASLFTGLYPVRNGAFQNHKPVYDSLQSVAHYLKEQGYRVGLTGKDHVTKPEKVFPFDIIPGFEPNCLSVTDDYFLDSIKNYITSPEPFCLFVMSINPHAPWTVGDPSAFDTDKLVLPSHWVDTKETRREFAKYLAEVRRLDDQVGDLAKLLEETNQAENTVVIFLGEQGAQFPGAKWTLWDEGQLSSMIVRWPKKIKAGSVSDAIVQYEDITPTLIDIAEGEPIASLDGFSFKNVLLGSSPEHREFAYGIHNNIPAGTAYPVRSIRSKGYKLILNLEAEKPFYLRALMAPNNRTSFYDSWAEQAESDAHAFELVNRFVNRPEIEFYDLAKDPHELNNLAGKEEYNEVIASFRQELREWMVRQGDTGADMDIQHERYNVNIR